MELFVLSRVWSEKQHCDSEALMLKVERFLLFMAQYLIVYKWAYPLSDRKFSFQ